MSRANSSRSNGSSLSLTSHMSHMDVRGNVTAFHPGSQASGTVSGMDSCLLLDSADANGDASQFGWSGYSLDMGMNADSASFPLGDLSPLQHVVPAQMQLSPDSHVPDNSSPSSWDQFSNSISRTPSPATLDDPWLNAPLSPDTSPEMSSQSPRYVDDATLESHEQLSYYDSCLSSDRKIHVIPDGHPGSAISRVEDALNLTQAFSGRRSNHEGEAGARDHHLYKTATPQADGLYHCPWEGDASCNHKPEKLKCNYE